MSKEDNIRRHEELNACLRRGDWAAFIASFPKHCLFNVPGHTALSGSWTDRDEFFAVGAGLAVTKLRPGAVFAKRSRIIVVDDHYSVGWMETEAVGINGVPYDQQYIQILGHRDGQIVEYWEFFDTVVMESVIFDNPLKNPHSSPSRPIDAFLSFARPEIRNVMIWRGAVTEI